MSYKSLKMEGFLEANRVMEVSLSKLNSINRSGDLPLRKTLLISKVLNRAQEQATSAHFSIINTTNNSTATTSSSKLLASISQDRSNTQETLPTGPVRPTRQLRQSPIASAALASTREDDESMDFENVNSVLSDILDMDMSVPRSLEPNTKRESTSVEKKTKLLDVSNTSAQTTNVWSNSTWQFELNSELRNCWQSNFGAEADRSVTPPASPGKRDFKVAFPYDQENAIFWDSGFEEAKRYKLSPPEAYSLNSEPSYYDYLSPKNLQSAPLITYMFGKGFAEPSNPDSESGWPEVSSVDSSTTDNHFVLTPCLQTSPIKFNPIMAF